MKTMGAALIQPRQRSSRSILLWAAGVVVALVLAGFAKTFFLRPMFLDVPLPPLSVVHGVVMSLWVTLFVAQVCLIWRGNVRWHRRLGLSGMLLAPLVLVLGVAMAVTAMRAGHAPAPQVTPQQFLAVPVFNIVVFAALAGTGLSLRGRPEIHRRLMLLAMLCLLPPAIARIPQELGMPGAVKLPLAITVVALIIVTCAVHDARRHHRLHPTFVFGGAAAILALPAALVASHTVWWQRFADLLM